jgi:hypothetical protein
MLSVGNVEMLNELQQREKYKKIGGNIGFLNNKLLKKIHK